MKSEAFVEAQNRLRDARERSELLRSDAEAVELLRGAGERVLGVVEDLLDDERLWDRLSQGGRLTEDDFASLSRFVDGGLPVLGSTV